MLIFSVPTKVKPHGVEKYPRNWQLHANGCDPLRTLSSDSGADPAPQVQSAWTDHPDWLYQPGMHVDPISLTHLLRQYGNAKALVDGNVVHVRIVRTGLEKDTLVGGVLVQMYGKCGSLEDASVLFLRMPERHLFLWNFMIRAYARQGYSEDAFRLFDQMQTEGVLPDRITFVCILSALTTDVALDQGKWIHSRIAHSNLNSNVSVGNALVSMYGKCGDLPNAHCAFDSMPERDVVSWTAMMSVYVQRGQADEAFKLFDQMLSEGVIQNKVTFIIILSACVSQETILVSNQMHARIVNSGFESDINLGNALINMYGKCGRWKDAWLIFDKMPERDVVSWNAVIEVHAQCGQNTEAFKLFNQMDKKKFKPNKVTFGSILSACAMPSQGMRIHACIMDSKFDSDVVLGTALVSTYGKCGSLEDAHTSFCNMSERNVTSWNAMIAVYSQHDQGMKVLQLFYQMQQQGIMANKVTFVSVLDVCANDAMVAEGKHMHARLLCSGYASEIAIQNALIYMYGKCGSVTGAREEFEKILVRDVVSWTAMISVYAQHGQGKLAFQVFEQMQWEGTVPDKVTCISILDVCASETALAEGEQIHSWLIKQGLELDVAAGTALVNMYGRSGNLDVALRVFEEIPDRNVASWTAMIAAYAYHGQGKEALQLFDRMLRECVVPDKVTFLSILAACSHGGLVEEGHQFLVFMNKRHDLSPIVDHYGGIIDLLGRAGRLDEAEKLIKDMPIAPTAVSYMALLGACRYQGDIKRAEHAAKCVFDLDPESPSPYVMLSNIYVAAGRVDDAEELLKRMKEKGVGFFGVQLQSLCT